MKVITLSDAKEFKNSQSCTVFEYPTNDKDINGAVAIINGRYPDEGFVVNEVCKEIVYVIDGSGSLNGESNKQNLEPGTVALIPEGEKYFFEGKNLKIFMPCTPAWYPEQHKEIH